MTHRKSTSTPIAHDPGARRFSSLAAALVLSLVAAASLAAQEPTPATMTSPATTATTETAPAAPAVAEPPKKSGTQIAEGLENWKAGIDLSAYPPGKYNLVIEGKDKAGNLTEYPPMNILIDPASDLPRVKIGRAHV